MNAAIERRHTRGALRVVHRLTVGGLTFARVSELVFVDGRPRAVLGWINCGGIRTPVHLCELDPAKLRRLMHGPRNTYYYDAATVDPRYVIAP